MLVSCHQHIHRKEQIKNKLPEGEPWLGRRVVHEQIASLAGASALI
jgi:hypothetical protein